MPTQKSDDAGKPAARGGATEAPPDEFHKFLVGLATDPAKLGAFIKDPDAAMSAAGLSEADQAVLKSGHPWMIHGRLAGQQAQAPINVVTPPITILVVDMAAAEAGKAELPTLRGLAYPSPVQGSSLMYPNTPLQIYPPIYPPPVYPVIYPQVHPQLVIHPQIVHPPIYPPPQIHPIWPIHPPPQIHPIWPPPQIHPIWPPPPVIQQLYPPVIPQLLVYTPYGR
jgi:hypothetical protein